MDPREYERQVARFLLRRLRGRRRPFTGTGLGAGTRGEKGPPPIGTFSGTVGPGNPTKWQDPPPPPPPKIVAPGFPTKVNIDEPAPPIVKVQGFPFGPIVQRPVLGQGGPIKTTPVNPLPPWPGAITNGTPLQVIITDGLAGDSMDWQYNQLVTQRRAFWDYTDTFAADTIAAGDWTPSVGTWAIAAGILSNTAFGASGVRGFVRYARQQSYYDVQLAQVVRNPASTQHAIGVRMTESAGLWSGYLAVARTGTYTIRRVDANVLTTIATFAGVAVADGDTLTLKAVGDALTFTAPGISGSLTATDATYGYGAVGQANVAAAIADFGTAIITDRPA